MTFCDMSQKAIDITGYGPRPCGVLGSYVNPLLIVSGCILGVYEMTCVCIDIKCGLLQLEIDGIYPTL